MKMSYYDEEIYLKLSIVPDKVSIKSFLNEIGCFREENWQREHQKNSMILIKR